MRPRDAARSTEKMWRQGGPCSLDAAQAAYEEQEAVPVTMGVPRGAARSKIEAREGTWRREYVLHQPLFRTKYGNH